MSNVARPIAAAVPESTGAARRAAALWSVPVVVVAVLVRWVTVPSLQGDDHWPLWTAAAFLEGDRPFRDFADLGDPLYWAMSALAQTVSGYRVIGEVALGTLMTAVAALAAFHLTREATGSTRLAWGLTILALLVTCERELYSYPKLVLYPVVLWLSWRYIDRPTFQRAAWLACGVAFAFGYRHDHGAYTGVGAAAALLGAHWSSGPRQMATAALRFGVVLLALVAPYLLLVQAHEGVVSYFQERLRLFGRMDDGSRQPVRLRADPSAPPGLVTILPPKPARVFVEWQPGVDAEARSALERRYALTNGSHAKDGWYDYTLSDVSADAIGALVRDPWIVDRRGLPLAPDVLPVTGSSMQIRWDPRVDDVERAALERRYHLTGNRNNEWEYALTAPETENIRALVMDPAVFDTGLIDRETFTPAEESWIDDLERAVPVLRLRILPRYWHVANAGVVLHHLFMVLPYMLLVLLVVDLVRGGVAGFMPHAAPKMFAAAVMTAVAFGALLRREGYFADHTALAVILGACGIGWVREARRDARLPGAGRASLRAAVVTSLVVFTAASLTFAQGSVPLPAIKSNVLEFWPRSVRRFHDFSVSPPIDAYAPRGASGDVRVLRYLYDCTTPDDRVWVASDLFRFPYYLQRRIVGHIYWDAGLLQDVAHQERTIATLERDRVPFIVSYGLQSPMEFLKTYPLVHEYVAAHYTGRYEITDEKGSELKFFILTNGRLTPTGQDPTFGLPCFK